jgi:hypothetical protein
MEGELNACRVAAPTAEEASVADQSAKASVDYALPALSASSECRAADRR